MDFDAGSLVLLCDRVGIVAFALSGVEVGARRRLDVFGLLVMGVVTATGGGVLRDLVLARTPFVIAHVDYLGWAVASSAAAIALLALGARLPRWLLHGADAAGLGAFAAAGALAAIEADLALPAVLLLGILTATGGGVLRDLLADRVPLVLHSEINATAAAAGAFAAWLLEPAPAGVAVLAGASVAAAARIAGIALGLNLPVPGRAPDDADAA